MEICISNKRDTMSIRCFIAIEIEDSKTFMEILKVKKELIDLDLGIKPVEDENIHLTLRFLGEIPPSSVEIMKNILLGLSKVAKKFEMEVKGLGAFPSIRNPRVLWVGVDKGAEELYNIRKYIDNEILRRNLTDVRREGVEFKPHITLARIKSLKNIRLLYDFYQRYCNFVFGVSPVTKIKLKQSILRPQGPIYRDIISVDLG